MAAHLKCHEFLESAAFVVNVSAAHRRLPNERSRHLACCLFLPNFSLFSLRLCIDLTYLSYSPDDEYDALMLWQPILRTVFLHLSLLVAI